MLLVRGRLEGRKEGERVRHVEVSFGDASRRCDVRVGNERLRAHSMKRCTDIPLKAFFPFEGLFPLSIAIAHSSTPIDPILPPPPASPPSSSPTRTFAAAMPLKPTVRGFLLMTESVEGSDLMGDGARGAGRRSEIRERGLVE